MINKGRPLPKNITARPRLFNRLDLLLKTSSIWLSANAGSGKTSLISSYIEHRNLACFWYQLDGSDADLGSFFYFLGQEAARCMFVECPALPSFIPENERDLQRFTLRYFDALFNCCTPPLLLVFDNYQELPADSTLHEVINRALLSLPEGMRAIFISRSDPPANFIRQRANQTLAMLRWEEVRFTELEALDSFACRDEVCCVPETMHHIHGVCDGWAAGLVLMSHVARHNPMEVEQICACSQEDIFSYFSQEVFSALDATTRSFLIKTALLPRMTGPMAVELTDCHDASERLQRLVQHNFFIVRDADAVYAFHPLYRDFLLATGERVMPAAEMVALRRQAAELLIRSGQIEVALELLSHLEEWGRMAEVLIDHAPDLLQQGRHHTLREWLDRIPHSMTYEAPWLRYWRGMCNLAIHPVEAQECFEQAFAGFQAASQPMGALLAASGAINAIAAGQTDFTPLARWFAVLNELIKTVRTYPNDAIEAWVTAGMVTALAVLEMPHPDADAWMRKARDLRENSETINPKIHALFQLFWFQGVNRGMGGLLPLLQEMQRLAHSSAATPHTQLVVCIAEIQYYEAIGLHAECLKAVEKALVFAERQGLGHHALPAHLMVVTSYLDRMDVPLSLNSLEAMRKRLGDVKPWAGSAIHHQLARTALLHNALDQALHHAEQAFRLGEKLGSPFIAGCSHWMMALVLHKLGRTDEARSHLDHCFAIVEHHGTRWMEVMAFLIEAYFAFECGDEARAWQSLRKSFKNAHTGEYLMVCIDDPAVTLQMCMKALEAGIEMEHVQKIIRRRGLVPDSPPIHLEQWPWPIRIYTLGRFSLVRNDKPLEPGRKAQQMPLKLLKVLIALGGREVAEERLADVLWPDSDGDLAHHAFETTLGRLRKMLGNPEALKLRAGKLSLNDRLCWVDIWAFERLLGQVEIDTRQQEGDRATDHLTKALALYQGDFLAREDEEAWRISYADRLQRRFLQAALTACPLLESAGRWRESAAVYQRCLDIDRANAEWSRRLSACQEKLSRTR